MNDQELLEACKVGLNISSAELDPIIMQKIKAVKAFMKNAGVSEEKLQSEEILGALVMGVGDLWQLKSGETRFSPAFFTLLTQLTYDGGGEDEA